MDWLRVLARRLSMLIHRRKFEAELEEEMRLHLELRQQDRLQLGMAADDAQAAARRQFGNLTSLRERSRVVWGWEWLDDAAHDVRYTLRVLRKSPGFTAAAVLTLALGIGANATIFSWINSMLLNPIPGVEHTGEYAELTVGQVGEDHQISYPDYCDLRDRNTTLSSLIAYGLSSMYLTGKDKPERVWGQYVSANYFDALGVQPFLGRGFLPSEGAKPGGAPVVVISYPLWETRFGSDRQIVGRVMEINKHQYTIVGVAPPIFQGTQTGLRDDLWLPIMMVQQSLNANANKLQDRGAGWLISIGRLKTGVTRAQAQGEINTLYRQISRQFPDSHQGTPDATLHSLSNAPGTVSQYFYVLLLLLMAICGVILLLACANVANLLLVRSVVRRREMAIRLSIGATRWRLVRQLLTESLVLVLCGGSLALLFTSWTAGTLGNFVPPTELPLSISVHLDRAVLLATLAISLLSGVVFGILPALRSSSLAPITMLKEESSGATGARRKARLSSMLVVAQIAMSLLLLICAGLFIRSFRLQQQFNPGFNPHNVLVDSYSLGVIGYNQDSGLQFHRRLLVKLQSLPGVQSAALSDWIPLGLDHSSTAVVAEGYVPQLHESMDIEAADVSPNYLHTMQIPLVAGREFTSGDTGESQQVAMVNQAFTRRYWPNQDVIGKRVHANGKWFTVVGITQNSDTDHLGQLPEPFLYLPLFQDYDPRVVIHVRVAGNPLAYVSAVQNTVHKLDADIPLFNLMTLDSRIALESTASRIGGVFLGAFGILALILAAMGIFGVLAYTTRQRTHEIGIRMALGADPREVFGLVLRQGAILVSLGITIGLSASLGMTRVLGNLLFRITTTDPVTFILGSVLLALVAFAACYIPARRAMKVDPIVALRYE